MKTVCLDAGHYGKYNRSPIVPEYYESDMVWKLHLLLKNYLEQLGIRVVTTRSDKNKDLALVSRGMAAKGCDLFLSLHSNACATESVNHAAIYHLVNDDTTSIDDLSKDFAKKIAPVIGAIMGVKYKVLSRNAVSDRNKDGLSNDNYYGVLHGASTAGVPGLILEHSFHTNKNATLWLLKDENLDKLARAEAECIASWLLGKTVKLGDTGNQPTEPISPVQPIQPTQPISTPFKVRVTIKDLNIRKGPGTNYAKIGKYVLPGVYTITEVKSGKGSKTGWGKLKSGLGWISLDYATKLKPKEGE